MIKENLIKEIAKADYVNDIAKRKGLMIRIVDGAYDVILPIGNPIVGKTRAQLLEFLRVY